MIEYAIGMYSVGTIGILGRRIFSLSRGMVKLRNNPFKNNSTVYLMKRSTDQSIIVLNKKIKEHHISYPFTVCEYMDKIVDVKHATVDFPLNNTIPVEFTGKHKRIDITDDNQYMLERFDLHTETEEDEKLAVDIYEPQDVSVVSSDPLCFTADKCITNSGLLYTSVMFNIENRLPLTFSSVILTTLLSIS